MENEPEDKAYEVESAHLVLSFQAGHSKDGKFMSLSFELSSDSSLTVAIPFEVQEKLIEHVQREFSECSRRREWHNDYADRYDE